MDLTANGQLSSALYATTGGHINMHGGSASLGDNATVVGNNQSPAVYAYNGGSITLDQKAQVNIGTTAGTNVLGNGVMAVSTDGSPTTVNLDDVTITQNQTGYSAGNDGRYLFSIGAGASVVANNVTTHSSKDARVASTSGAQMNITNSSLNNTMAYNLASTTAGPATTLTISNTSISNTRDNFFGVLGTNWVASTTARGVTTLTDDTITISGNAASTGSVYNAGVYSAGVMADTTSDIAIHGGSITTNGTSSMGVEATDNSAGAAVGGAGVVTIDAVGAKGPTHINTAGTGAYGLYANLGGVITATDASVTTNGDNADGVRATLGDANNASLSTANVRPSSITMTGGSVTTTGANANGAALDGGTAIKLTDVAVNASGHGVSVNDTNATGHINTVTVTGRALASAGDAFAVTGANTTISVSGTSPITPGSGNILNLTGGGSTTFTASNEVLNGNIISDAASSGDVYLNDNTLLTGLSENATNISIDSSSTWNVTGNSTVSQTLTNAGTIAYTAPVAGAFRTLTTQTYTGNSGLISFNTYLGDDSSATDRLVVNGDTSGSTNVRVANAGGPGAQTVEGIKIIDVGGNSAGTFSLLGDTTYDGDQAVVGGAYAYRLYKNGVSTPSDGDWYLRSSLIPTKPVDPGAPVNPTNPEGPLYQPGVPTYEAYPQALLGLNGVSTLQQRVGNRFWAGAGNRVISEGADPIAPTPYAPPEEAGVHIEGNGVWGRIEGAHNSIEPRPSTSGTDYDQNIFKVQAGLDGLLMHNESGKLIGGITVHYVHGKTDTDWRYGANGYGDGEISTDGYGFGGTLTWYDENGFYIDSQAQVTWYNSDMSANPNGTMTDGNDGFGYTLSVESGKRIALDPEWSVTPQGQLVYSSVDFDDFTDTFGVPVSLDKGDSLQGRLGITLDHENSWKNAKGLLNRSHVFGIANLYYEFLNGTKVHVAGVSFASGQDRLWGGVGVGGSYNWDNDKYSVYGEGLVNTSLNNFGDSYSLKGNLGFRVKW